MSESFLHLVEDGPVPEAEEIEPTGLDTSPAAPAPVPTRPPFPTCGEYGGIMANGQPCTQKAGFAVTNNGTGVCIDHTPERLAEIAALKAEFLRRYEAGDAEGRPIRMREAANAAGMSHMRLFRLRHADPVFNAQCAELALLARKARIGEVEEAAFERATDAGSSADTLRMFLLMNQMSEEYQDRRVQVKHEGTIRHDHEHQHKVPAWDTGTGQLVPFAK